MIGESHEGADQVAIKVINLKTAQAAFVEKFLPRELDVAKKLGLVERNELKCTVIYAA